MAGKGVTWPTGQVTLLGSAPIGFFNDEAGKSCYGFFDSDALLDKPGPNYNLVALLVASVAQLAEQLTLNQLVEGSSPSRGTTLPRTYENPPERKPLDEYQTE